MIEESITYLDYTENVIAGITGNNMPRDTMAFCAMVCDKAGFPHTYVNPL
jgi:hypothetical protein